MPKLSLASQFSLRHIFTVIFMLSIFSNILFSQPLNGNKFIGPTGDYLTITSAINALYSNTPNIDGPVIFAIEDGTYNEHITLTSAITGSNSTNTVTFVSKSLNPSSVIISPTSSNIVINIQNAENLIFQDITFTTPSTGMVAFAETAGNITFTGNIFNGSSTIFSPNDQNILLLASLSGGKLNDVTITNNVFNDGYNGIVLGSELYGENLDILNNTFSTINSAIYLTKFDAPNIRDNVITNNSDTYAISLNELISNLIVMSNKITTTTNLGSGITIINSNAASTSTVRGRVINNFIQAGYKGISLNNTDYVDVEHNSISIENISQTTDNSSASFEVTAPHSNSRITNNIFSNNRSGYSYIGITGTSNVSNYNDLYTTGPIIGKWNSTDQVTMSDFKNASSTNAQSVDAKPFFTSLTDLHASSPQIDNEGGQLLYSIPADIDGDARDLSTPSIGADEFSSVATPLNGNYTIGSSGEFSSITEAVDALYYHGISSSVIFKISPDYYTEQIDLNGMIPGSSSSSIVNFEGQTGDPSDVLIQHTASGIDDNFILRIDEAEYVNFKFLGFVAQGTDFSRIVQFENVNGNFEFYKSGFTGNPNSTISDKNQAIIYLDDSGILDNTNISSNIFNGGSYGMYLNLSSASTGIVIHKNTISSVGSGIFLTNADAPVISSNTINTDLFYAVTLFYSTNNFVIEKNKISAQSGISINQSDGTSSLRGVIKNNFVAAKDKGIALNAATYTDVYFNSVHIDATSPSPSSSAFSMLSAASSQNIIKNNIFYNSTEGYAYNWGSGDLLESDYNNLFSNGENLGFYYGINYTKLSTFQSATGFDDNSVSDNITFASSTDLHIVGVNPPSTGVSIPTILDDIDGETRNDPPFIGADKFSLPPLNGVYAVGTGGAFATITDGIDYMYLYGIDGAVTFNILSGTYNEQIDLDGAITGSSAINTVTFQSASGDSTDVTFTHTALATGDNFVLRINTAEHIKINNLSLTAGGTDFARVVYIEDLNGNLEFTGNIFTGVELTLWDSSSEQSVVFCKVNSVKLNNSTFQNNIINNGRSGLYLINDGASPRTSNLKIIGNEINSHYEALNLQSADAPLISSNTFTNKAGVAVSIYKCEKNFIIESNKLICSSGISLSTNNTISSLSGIVKNNFIAASFIGLRVSNSRYIDIQFNTININSSSPNSISKGIYIFESGTIDPTYNIIIQNNIINNMRTSYAIVWSAGTNIQCDYNNLYTNGTYLAQKGTTDYTTLATWQAPVGSGGSGLDENSYNETVTFTSDEDLHIVSTSAPLLGTVISGITEDIDGETRANPPFIGADEPNGIFINLTLFLEGPYSSGSSNMNASLTIETTSPYSEDPVTVNPIPDITNNEIVDWVLVQLRNKNDNTDLLESKSAFIRKDGSIVSLDGTSPVHFSLASDSYFVSVKHRNHLAVMSNGAITIN